MPGIWCVSSWRSSNADGHHPITTLWNFRGPVIWTVPDHWRLVIWMGTEPSTNPLRGLNGSQGQGLSLLKLGVHARWMLGYSEKHYS